jgi:hypothetical protein
LTGGHEAQTLELPNLHGTGVTVVRGSATWKWNDGPSHDIRTGETWLLPVGLSRIRIDPGEEDLRLLLSSPRSFD